MNAQEEIDKVYAAYKCCPVEQIKHIPFAQFIATRFITVDEHNDIVQRLSHALEDIQNRHCQCGNASFDSTTHAHYCAKKIAADAFANCAESRKYWKNE